MAYNIHGTMISEKTNKIRWRPDPLGNSHSFITGSWDNIDNSIKLWDYQEKDDDPDIFPFIISSFPFKGDVTEMKFLDPDNLVVSSSTGSVYILRIVTDETGGIYISEDTCWNKLHKFINDEYSSCTSLSTYDNDIATVGEDGRINFLTMQRGSIIRCISEADSCSLSCVTFLKHNEILTGNLRGQMKIWDLRSAEDVANNSFMLSDDQVAATCLTYHPTQRHMVIAGDEEGSLTIWDLRRNTVPVNLLSAHSETVSELKFHPDIPDQLFSCSSSGEVWHWQTNAYKQPSTFAASESLNQNPWFTSDNIKKQLEVQVLMSRLHKPVNSIDLNKDKILCGCDNEAIYLINGINIYH